MKPCCYHCLFFIRAVDPSQSVQRVNGSVARAGLGCEVSRKLLHSKLPKIEGLACKRMYS